MSRRPALPLRRPAEARDAGMVTAELAACLPVLALLLAFAVSLVLIVAARVRLQDAAAELARATARGDTATGRRLATEQAPGATVAVTTSGSVVIAVARQRVRPLGGWLPGVELSERAVTEVEPGSP